MCKGARVYDYGVSNFHIISTVFLGEELSAFLARHQTAFDRIVYIGDGSNDFCPILRMRRFVSAYQYYT